MPNVRKKSSAHRILTSAIQKVYKAEHANSFPLDPCSREYQNTRTRVLQFKYNHSANGRAASHLKDLMTVKIFFARTLEWQPYRNSSEYTV